MDKLELEVLNISPEESQIGKREVLVQLRINDVLIVPGLDYPVDIGQLVHSIDKDGFYNIWTCYCGIAMCAGLAVEAIISHSDDKVIWELRDLPFTEDAKYIFDKGAYKVAICNCFKEFNNVITTNKSSGLVFEIYPDTDYTGLTKFIDGGFSPCDQ